MNNWRPVDELPEEYYKTRKMFVVMADTSLYEDTALRDYVTDSYCVWIDSRYKGTGVCGRWPHSFPPTHFCELPEYTR